jgi:hypothetical protein
VGGIDCGRDRLWEGSIVGGIEDAGPIHRGRIRFLGWRMSYESSLLVTPVARRGFVSTDCCNSNKPEAYFGPYVRV